jgi:hypothetical protein
VRDDATDRDIEVAVTSALDTVVRDRGLRRHLRDDRLRGVAEVLVRWEVVVAAVGADAAEERYERLVGHPPPADLLGRDVVAAGAPERGDPAGASTRARAVAQRTRRVSGPVVEDTALLEELSEAESVEANPDDDPRKELGFDHAVWLEEWLESTVGSAAFDGIEVAVDDHPEVGFALHEDREVPFVSAPHLHPEDVRAVVVEALAELCGAGDDPAV